MKKYSRQAIKIKNKTIIILSILFLLPSCVFLTENTLKQTISTNSFINRFPSNQKTIVIIKLNGKSDEKIYMCDSKNNIFVTKESCLQIYATNQYTILMLEPSLYYLIIPPRNRPIFYNHNKQIVDKKVAEIEVVIGEIQYVGDINYRTLYRKLVVNNNFKNLKNLFDNKNLERLQELFTNQGWEINFLFEQYPQLKNRFKKRLLKKPKLIEDKK
jgi:hypothetical protein